MEVRDGGVVSDNRTKRTSREEWLRALASAIIVGLLANAGIWYQNYLAKHNDVLQEKQRIHAEFAHARWRFREAAFERSDALRDYAVSNLLDEINAAHVIVDTNKNTTGILLGSKPLVGRIWALRTVDQDALMMRNMRQEYSAVGAALDEAITHFGTNVVDKIEIYERNPQFPSSTVNVELYRGELFGAITQGWAEQDRKKSEAVIDKINNDWDKSFLDSPEFTKLSDINGAMEQEINSDK